jgi:cobalt/nickel transport system ATP-binding protein
MRAIDAEKVTYIYPDGTVGVEDVTIQIEEGERVGIIGANGSGKSTLIFLLAGLLKPSKGKIEIYGMKPEKENLEKIRRLVGVVFQNPDDFLFNPTVRDELTYVPLQLEWSMERIERAVEEYSNLFGLDGVLKKPPFRLSGGEKKKVEIASVLIAEPRILFLDEPTANIDGKTRRLIIDLLKKFDGTLVVASHEVEVIRSLADRLIVLNLDHKLETNGGIEILESREVLEKAGIL